MARPLPGPEASDDTISLDGQGHPEFDAWRWTGYWTPLDEVIEFKRKVYDKALNELAPLVEGIVGDTGNLTTNRLPPPSRGS